MKFIAKKYCNSGDKAKLLLASLMLVLMVSCVGKSQTQPADSSEDEGNQFHADYDIAMTVCSLVDAVRVGERLDSVDYDFEGVLTDGQGTPLYTDVEGNPGLWRVRVIGDDKASISNLHIGDLLTADLREYIVGALGLNDADLATAFVNPHNESELVWLYDLGDSKVAFSEMETKSKSGLEGIIMTVTVTK